MKVGNREITVNEIKSIKYHLGENDNILTLKSGEVLNPDDDECLAINRQIRNLPNVQTRRTDETLTYIL